MAATINVSEAEFTAVASAACEARDSGDMETANTLDVLARKINAALSRVSRPNLPGSPKRDPYRWEDVPSVLDTNPPAPRPPTKQWVNLNLVIHLGACLMALKEIWGSVRAAAPEVPMPKEIELLLASGTRRMEEAGGTFDMAKEFRAGLTKAVQRPTGK